MPKYLYMEDMASPAGKLFGVRLREKRTALNLSQAMLFERTGIAASYISYIERGKGNPTLDMMVQLSDAVGCHISEMLAPDDKAQK